MATFTLVPEFEYVESDNYNTIRTEFDFGYVQTRAFWPKVKRLFTLNWDNANDVEKEYTLSFFRDRIGGGESFSYVPVDPIPTPATAGTPGSVTSGALGSRTYYYHFTWKNANGETRAYDEGTYAVAANDVMTLTVPKFPTGVTSAVVYASEVSGDTDKQGTEITDPNDRVWQEPDTGLIAGDPPPTLNTATETVTVILMDDVIQWRKRTPVSYSITLQFEEVL